MICSDSMLEAGRVTRRKTKQRATAPSISGSTAAEIVASIGSAIRSGVLNSGAALPTIRQLANDLGVNRNTVLLAYRRLAEARLIVSNGRRGSRIVDAPFSHRDGDGSRLRDLGGGDTDPTFLPSPMSVLGNISVPIYVYDDPAELPSLLAFTQQLLTADRIPSDHVTFTNGAFDALRDLLAAYLKPGDSVAVEDPCFMTTLYLLRGQGFRPVGCAVDDDGVRPDALADALESGAKAVFLTPYGQNPTGAAWTSARRNQIKTVLDAYPDVIVIEDDHLRALIEGSPPRSIAATRHGRWAVIRSVSKYLGPDLRFAYVAGDDESIQQIRIQRSRTTRRVSHIVQHVVLKLMEADDTWSIVGKAAHTYAERRQSLLKELARVGIAAHGRTGLHVWVPVSDEAMIAEALLHRGWAVRSGAVFRLRAPQAIRVTIGSLDPIDAAQFAEDLAYVLRHLQLTRGAYVDARSA